MEKNIWNNTEELLQFNLKQVIHQSSSDGIKQYVQKVLSGIDLGKIVAKTVAKNGSIIEVVGKIMPVRHNENKVILQGYFQNITEVNLEKSARIKVETRLQSILDNMMSGCYIVNFEWEFVYVNKTAAKQGYMGKNKLIGQNMLKLYPNLKDSEIYKMYAKCMFERVNIHCELNYQYENGIEKWFEFQLEPVEEGIFIISIDITEKKLAEEKAKTQQLLYEKAEKIALIGSWKFNAIKNSYTWTSGLFEILELNMNLIKPSYDHFLSLVHPSDKENILLHNKLSLFNKSYYSIDYRLQFEDGRIKYISEHVAYFFDDAGNHLRTVGTLQDNTETKLYELQLEENEKKYRQLVENIPDSLSKRDLNGKLFYCNKQYADIFGLSKIDLEIITNSTENHEEILFPSFLSKEHKSIIKQKIINITNGETSNEPIFFDGIVNGRMHWFEGNITPIYEDGNLIGTQAIMRDITERISSNNQVVKQNLELKKINFELDSFVYRTSHDLRSPLTTLLGLIDLSKDTNDLNEMLEYLDMMKIGIDRMDSTIRNIIEYSKNIRSESQYVELNIHQVIDEIMPSLQNIKYSDQVTFKINILDNVRIHKL